MGIHMNAKSLGSVVGIALLTIFQASCVSNRGYQQSMDLKDAEIRKLREERAQLKAQNQSLSSSLNSARVDAVPAGSKAAEQPEATKFREIDSMGITYGMRDGNMVISIPSSITFASGQAELSKDGQKALKEVASTLKAKYSDAKYSIEGHTDTDPIKKSKFTSNRDLSIARARAVLTWLVEECGIRDDQCIVVGHGQ